MLSSMTAYGEGHSMAVTPAVNIWVKTLNHRYLELSIRGLESYPGLELYCRQLVKRSFARGRVEVNIGFERSAGASISCDTELAKGYYQVLEQLAQELELSDRPSLGQLIGLEGVLRHTELPDPEALQPALTEALEAALQAARQERQREGAALGRELAGCLQSLQEEITAIEAQMPQLLKIYAQKLRDRVQELTGQVALEPGRLEAEAALLAERADITEELARLRIHLQAALQALDSSEPTGRTLDFLAQEMNREANTIGAKARDGQIASRIITIKSLIDQLREQVRNIE